MDESSIQRPIAFENITVFQHLRHPYVIGIIIFKNVLKCYTYETRCRYIPKIFISRK